MSRKRIDRQDVWDTKTASEGRACYGGVLLGMTRGSTNHRRPRLKWPLQVQKKTGTYEWPQNQGLIRSVRFRHFARLQRAREEGGPEARTEEPAGACIVC